MHRVTFVVLVLYGGDFVGVVIFFPCGNHMRRPPRSAAENVCLVSYLFLFLFFKKKLISWGCAIVSVCFPHFGGSVSTPAPVVMGLGTRVLRRCARAGLHTALPVPRHSFRDHRTRVVGTAPSCIWELARTATAKVRGQEGMRCRPQHNSTLLPIGSQASLRITLLTHGVFIGSWHAPGTFELALRLHQYIPCTSAAAAASFPAFRSWVLIPFFLFVVCTIQRRIKRDGGSKKKDSGTRAAGFPWEIAGNQRNFQHLFSGNSLPQLLLAGLKQSCGAGGRVYYRVGVVAGTFIHRRREPLVVSSRGQ